MNCLLCNGQVDQGLTLSQILSFQALTTDSVCSACRRQFSPLNRVKTCRLCGRKLLAAMPDPCLDCEKWRRGFPYPFASRSLYEYNDAMREFMKRYKFMGDYRLRAVFSPILKAELRTTHRLIVPIPVHESTMATRGFNQVTGVLESLKLCECLATRDQQKTGRQSAKNRLTRVLAEQPFKLKPDTQAQITAKPVVLVDDVYTTGTTIRHAAGLLMAAGAASVVGLTLAR